MGKYVYKVQWYALAGRTWIDEDVEPFDNIDDAERYAEHALGEYEGLDYRIIRYTNDYVVLRTYKGKD